MNLGKKVRKEEMSVYGFACSCSCGSSSCHCLCSSTESQRYANARTDSADTYADYKVNRDNVEKGTRYSTYQ